MSHRQKYYGKDHIHQPAKGVGAYSREDRRKLTEEELNEIIEAGYGEFLKASRPYGELDPDE